MFKSMISNDPTELELHIQRSIASFKDGMKLSALYGIGIFLLGLFAGSAEYMTISVIGIFFFLMPGCQFWSIVLRRSIRLPKFFFWGNIEFVLLGYFLQFSIWVLVYIGGPLFFLAVIFSIVGALSPVLSLIVSVALLLWPLTMFGYISAQRYRLSKLTAEAEATSPDSKEGRQGLLALQ